MVSRWRPASKAASRRVVGSRAKNILARSPSFFPRTIDWPTCATPSDLFWLKLQVSLRAHRLFPEDDVFLAVGDEGYTSILRNDDRKPSGVIVRESIRGAMARAHSFDVVDPALASFGVERAPDRRRRGQLGRHLSTETDQSKSLVENDSPVDRCEVGDDATQL